MATERVGKPAVAVRVDRPFRFRSMILSHGWYDLAPFVWDDAGESLRSAFHLGDRAVCFVVASAVDARGGRVLRASLQGGGPLSPADRKEAARRLVWMFRLDEDYRPFHAACGRHRALRWVVRDGLGAFLRNPGLFEELAKILLTTNISWAGTRSMTRALVEWLGDPVRPWYGTEEAPRAFPAAESIAGVSERSLRRNARLGYRAPYLLDLADGVASGRTVLARFLERDRPVDDLARAIGSLKGFGPYAVSAALLSLGRYERLVLDSWIRGTVARMHFRSPRVSDRSIERLYARWGEWKALGCWFDCAWDSWMKDVIGRGETARLLRREES
ncbi:MAG: hypothetical protein ABIH26_08540 [Candidatus Eisenbacteria bacterium]